MTSPLFSNTGQLGQQTAYSVIFQSRFALGLSHRWCNMVLHFHTAFAKLPRVIKFTVAITTQQLYHCYSSAGLTKSLCQS